MDLDCADIICRATEAIKGRVYSHPSTGLFYIDPKDIEPLDKQVLLEHPHYNVDYATMSNVINTDVYDHYENILFPCRTTKTTRSQSHQRV